MRVTDSVFIPASIGAVFAFLADPSNTLGISDRPAENARGIEAVAVQPDGRKTVDIRMEAGGVRWVQTIEQVIREEPNRLVSRSWTWTDRRDAPLLSLLSDRRLDIESDGTRLTTIIEYQAGKPSLFQRARLALQRGSAQLELEHQLHALAERFASRDSAR